ncbi:hypothetical protein G7054_g4696 [Neopestalotiopsis clavispora]|nr:hypothetical protein G7054_g4696 [Neopestalotiopsis clavispora]
MKVPISFTLLLLGSALAADLPCDVESDSCRAVINGSACFNKFMAGGNGNKNSMLSCLTGTEGSATPQQKVRPRIRYYQREEAG